MDTSKPQNTTTSAASQTALAQQNPEPANGGPLAPADINLEYGAFGTSIFSGFITNEEYNTDLTGISGLKIYDEMRKSDATVRASLNIVKYPIMSANWTVEAASDDPLDQKVADFVNYNLFESMDFDEFLREALTYLDFGFFVGEKIYDYGEYPGDKDGNGAGKYIMLKAIRSRKQTGIRRWQLPNGEAGIVQTPLTGGEHNIPAAKLVIFSYDREGANYAGNSILRSAYKHWKLKSSLELIEAIAHEKRHVGVPVIVPPQQATEADKKKAEEAVKNIRANSQSYVMLPFGWTLEWANMGTPGTDIGPTRDHHDRQIMKNVLGQFLEIGSKSSSGSRSTGVDQSRLLEQALEAVAKVFSGGMAQDVIKQLVDLNFNVKVYPKVTHDRIADDNVQVLSAAVASLGAAGFLTADAGVEESLRKTLHLPDLPDDIKNDYNNRPKNVATPAPAANPNDPNANADMGAPDAGIDGKPADNVNASEAIKQFHTAVGALLDAESNT